MIRRSVLALIVGVGVGAGVVVGAAAGRTARANGRLPATSTITFRHGHEADIAAGLTFGLLLSHDGGKSWTWVCESAVGYGGMYDPSYAFSQSSALFATTFSGLTVMRNGCTFDPTPEAKSFVSANTIGPDGSLWWAAAQVTDASRGLTADFKIYRSLDDGMTLPVGVKPGAQDDVNVWWQSIQVAPSNAEIVYLSGYRFIPNPAGSGTVRDHLLFRRDINGVWTELLKTGLTLMPNSVIHLAGIWNDNPAHLYARVELVDNTQSDALYVSTDSGATWTEIRRKATTISAFVARAADAQGKHDLIAGTVALGAEISHDDGKTWTALAGAPHMGCLVENAAGELWACTQNYDVVPVPSDGAGIMKTTDLVTWTKVLRYQDLTEAASCAAGTLQHDACVPLWCAVCAQLGCTASASYACPVPQEAPLTTPPGAKGGCCDTGAGPGGPLALALSVATMLLRPRRRRDR